MAWHSDGKGSLSDLKARLDQLLPMSDEVSTEFGAAAKELDAVEALVLPRQGCRSDDQSDWPQPT